MEKVEKLDTKKFSDVLKDMLKTIGVEENIGLLATQTLFRETERTKKPIRMLAEKGLIFFTNRTEDGHSATLLAVFSLVLSRTLFDPGVSSITIEVEKGGDIKK